MFQKVLHGLGVASVRGDVQRHGRPLGHPPPPLLLLEAPGVGGLVERIFGDAEAGQLGRTHGGHTGDTR